MTREETQARIKQLRERANRLRDAANHADSRAAYSEDLTAARLADAEADELEKTIHDRRAQR